MSLSGFLPVVSRRAIVISGVALASAISVAALQAQQTTTPPQTTAPQTPAAPEQKDPLKFENATPRVVFIGLTPDAAGAMEEALKQAKDVLGKSDKPEQKTQAAHWKVIKGGPQTDGSIPMIFVIDQTVPNVSYNPFMILQGAGLSAQEYTDKITPLFNRVNAGFKNFLPIEGTLIDLGAAGGGGH